MATAEKQTSPSVSDERRHPLAECEKCPLFNDKTAYVPSVLPEGADVAFIGEAPGRQEVRAGRPFIGPSGKLLGLVLGKHGIDPDTVVLTNAVNCQSRRGDITPSPAAIRSCRPRLVAEVEGCSTVVPMGNSAAQSTLGRSTKITQERVGPSKLGSPILPDKRIIPTIHPAACLRFSDHFPYLVNDVAKVNQSDERRWAAPSYKVWNTEREVTLGLQALAKACPVGAPLAIDIETGVEKDDNYTHPTEILCIGLSWRPDKAIVIERDALKSPVVQKHVTRFLGGRKLVPHNGKFDLQVLNNVWGLWLTNDELHTWFDTMLASYALDERPGTNSLDYNGQEILGAPNWKGVIKKYINPKKDSYAKVPPKVLDEYNAYDVTVTYPLYELFAPALEAGNLVEPFEMMVRFGNALAYVEKDGVRVDMDYNAQLHDDYLEILDPLENQLKPWVDNPRSWMQVRRALAPMLGIEQEEALDKVGSTADDIERYMELGLARKQDELVQFCKLKLEYAKEHKRYSTYVKGIRKRTRNGRVYPTYLVHGTTSGRLSSRNPNVQNQPRGNIIRKQYIPDDGNIFVQGDYSGAENRVVAVESGDQYLTDHLDEWNRMVAERLYGVNYTEEQYVRGKAMVHGTNYGREAYSIAMEYGMSEAEAKKYLREYKGLIPGVVAWQNDIKKTILAGQPLVTAFGRKRRFHLITKDNMMDMLKEGLSFKPQSTASDINNNALVELVNLSKTEYRGVMWVRIPVHDSILAEWREDLLEEGAHVMKDVMERAALLYTDKVPFKVEVEYGYNWGDKTEYDFDEAA